MALSLALGLFSCKKNEEEPDSSSPTEEPAVEPISFLDYSVIRPDKCSETVLDNVSLMYMKLIELSGKDNLLDTDYLPNGEEADSNAKEILVGHTNRPETEQVLSQLEANEFAVAVVGNKVVITGIVEMLTVHAVNYFIETYLADGADGKLAGDLFYKQSADTVTLIDRNEPVYTIVRPQYAFDGMMDLCLQLYDIIYETTGISIPVKTDELLFGETHDENAYEILIGDVSYDIVNEVKSNVMPDEYSIQFVGNKIIVYAWSAEGIAAALNVFSEMLEYGYYIDADGNTTVCIEKKNVASADESLNFYTDVPYEIDGRRYNSVYNAYDGAMMLYWDDATDDMLNTYAASLVADGFTLHQSLDNESVHSVTYAKGKVSVCAYILKRIGELRVIAQDNVSLLPVQPYEYEKICDPCVTQVGSYKSYDPKATWADMGYIIRLEDGTFVMIDGGLDWTQTVKDVYDKLVELKPPEMDEIIISAWFITHGHGDHYGVLKGFIREYSDKVTVKMLLGNDLPNLANGISEKPDRGFNYYSAVGKFGGCVNVKIHTGQQFFFPGATFTVLSTHEDVFPNAFNRYNEYATTVFDTVIEDTRFMWLGDAEVGRAGMLADVYKDALKCDVVQMAHHGSGNTVTTELYDLCDPDRVFWPVGYGENMHMNLYTHVGPTRHLVNMVGWENVYILGEGFHTIWFRDLPSTGGMNGSSTVEGTFTKEY